MWTCAQAKGSCEDYDPVSPEGSMSSFNNTSPGPTPSTTMADGQPVTRGMFLWSRNLQENTYEGMSEKVDVHHPKPGWCPVWLWGFLADGLLVVIDKFQERTFWDIPGINSIPSSRTSQSQLRFSSLTDLQTGPPNHKGITENTAIIAGVVAALVLLVALTLLAVYYINTHPTVAPPFYLMQVRKTDSNPPLLDFFFSLSKDTPHAHSCLSAAWPLATPVCCS